MTSEARDFARRLRRDQTSAEALVWEQLRDRRLAGAKFRRQVPIGPYVVDFLCVARKLVVEVDGSQHESEVAYDARRTAELEAQGLTVVRLRNEVVRERLDDALAAIRAALGRW